MNTVANEKLHKNNKPNEEIMIYSIRFEKQMSLKEIDSQIDVACKHFNSEINI